MYRHSVFSGTTRYRQQKAERNQPRQSIDAAVGNTVYGGALAVLPSSVRQIEVKRGSTPVSDGQLVVSPGARPIKCQRDGTWVKGLDSLVRDWLRCHPLYDGRNITYLTCLC
jgi:hypothetical protein